MPFPLHRPRPPVAVLIATALLAAGTGGCSALAPFSTCEGTDARLRELDALPLLASAPAGAEPAPGSAGAYAECVDDSGDAWLSAGRLYFYPGTEQEVVAHYREAAVAGGWQVHTTRRPSADGRPELCLTQGEEGHARKAEVRFVPRRALRDIYRLEPNRESARKLAFEIAAEAATDGAESAC
ncbi:hypothetical protein AB0O18_23215 [Streptomyces sp. NPDC093224]|uniref:hypothetical protein n=1 Tax=Streptomyces sp. NPDC093224 TaxID=3155198 RepID=UPI003416B565